MSSYDVFLSYDRDDSEAAKALASRLQAVGKGIFLDAWRLVPGEPWPAILEGHKGPVRTLAFSPDGRWLASGGEDHVLRLWLHHPNDEDLMTLACQRASRNLTPEEWRQYLGKRPYRETCPR